MNWFGVAAEGRLPPLESSSECDSNVDSEVSSHSLHYQTGWLFLFAMRTPGILSNNPSAISPSSPDFSVERLYCSMFIKANGTVPRVLHLFLTISEFENIYAWCGIIACGLLYFVNLFISLSLPFSVLQSSAQNIKPVGHGLINVFKPAMVRLKHVFFTVIPAGTIQIATQGEGVPGLHTLSMSNSGTAGGTIVQYAQGQDAQFFVPGLYNLNRFLK